MTYYDTQCGFKLLARDPARSIAALMKTDGFAFDVELILLAYHMGIQIDEVMIHWKEMGKSSIRLRHVFQLARDILAIRRNTREFK